MGRLLVLVLLVVAAVWLIRRALRAHSDNADARNADLSRKSETPDELVSCAHCGLLLPRAEARRAAGALYCTEEHERLGPGKR